MAYANDQSDVTAWQEEQRRRDLDKPSGPSPASFPGDPASVPDLAGECERCGAAIPRRARLCEDCARLD